MTINMNEIVFENKNSKLKAFLMPVIGSVILYLIYGIPRMLMKDPSSLSKNVKVYLILLGAFLLIGLAAGLHSAVRIKKMRITINDEGIDVIKGKAHGFYPLDTFLRCQRETQSAGRSVKVVKSLVFDGDEGLLYIDCDGFSDSEFLRMSDAISIRKHDVSECDEDSDEQLSDGRYVGTYELAFPSALLRLSGFFGVAILFAWGAAIYLISKSGLDRSMIILLGLITFGTISAVVLFLSLSLYYKKQGKNVIKTLQIGLIDLKVNDDTWVINNIRDLYITPPFLTDLAGDHRVLVIKVRDSSQVKKYIIEPKPKTYNANDPYIKLYKSIVDMCESHGIHMNVFDDTTGKMSL